MSSQLQIDSARRNGALSRGPKTPEGRYKSSLNSVKHGLNSKKLFVLTNESEEVFSNALEAVQNEFLPETQMELDICVEMAHARWRLRRLWIIETAMIDREMDRQHQELMENFTTFDEGTRLAAAFESLASGHGALGALTRYEGRLTRNFHKLAGRLEELRRARRNVKKSQNEPDFPNGDAPYEPRPLFASAPGSGSQSDSPSLAALSGDALSEPRPLGSGSQPGFPLLAGRRDVKKSQNEPDFPDGDALSRDALSEPRPSGSGSQPATL